MSRASLLAALAVAALAIPSAPAAAQDVKVAGAWELSWDTPRGAQTVTVVFQQDGMNVTGTATMRMGDVPVKNGMLHGDQLTFVLEFGRGDRTFSQSFAATVKESTMEGKITTQRGENPFTGKRKEG